MLQDAPVVAAIRETYECLRPALKHLSHSTPKAVRDALDHNAFIFSGFKAYHSLREVGLSLTREDGHVKSLEEFKESVRAIHGRYNERYLPSEYEHAVGSVLMADRWHATAPKSILEYRTAGDNKVRPAHEALDRTRLPKEDRFWMDYFPPNGWGCRCDAVEVSADTPLSDPHSSWERGDAALRGNKQELFRGNPGRDLRLYPDKHPYYGERGISHCSIAKHSKEDSECEVLRELEQIKAKEDEFKLIPTKQGQVLRHIGLNSQELKKNTVIASWLANTHGYHIRLYPDKSNLGIPSYDSYNETLERAEEYKTLTEVKLNTIKQEIRNAIPQAPHVVLMLPDVLDDLTIARAVGSKFKDHPTLQSVRFISPNDEGVLYDRIVDRQDWEQRKKKGKK
jgi:SPP1 gp7 family putative phage head morphogenesis protein